MHDFDYDVMQKKRLARNAKYKKNGSKSKRCTLPSDYLTAKEKRALNGECKTYKMSAPMTWEEFKEMPYENQRLYITGLKQKFDITMADLTKLFGCTYKAVSQYITRHDICKEMFVKRGGKRSSDHYAKFEEWINSDGFNAKYAEVELPVKKEVQYTNINAPKKYVVLKKEEPKNDVGVATVPCMNVVKRNEPMISTVSLCFDGPFSVKDLSIKLFDILKAHSGGRECLKFSCDVQFSK